MGVTACTLAAHADWSRSPGKRWITIALRDDAPRGGGLRDGRAWRVEAPAPVGDIGTLIARLLARAGGGAVALGVDFPLGLPRAYAALHAEARGFRDWLAGLAPDAAWFDVCATLDQVCEARPFYPSRGIAGMTRASHASALGLATADELCRACDRATAERPAGSPLFWTLGAAQSGKAAIEAWRGMLLPALASGAPLRLWPFDGDFLTLLRAPGVVAMAETYPAEALRQLGLRMGGSKRRQSDRARLGAPLSAALANAGAIPSAVLAAALADGFGAKADGEDRFDTILGLLCVLAVLDGRLPDGVPDDPWLRRWEGWVLGQTALPMLPSPKSYATVARRRSRSAPRAGSSP